MVALPVRNCKYLAVAFEAWEDAAEALSDALAPSEPGLVAFASSLGIDISQPTDRLLLVARIEDAVASVTGHDRPRPSTSRQVELLATLGVHVASAMSRREADAAIRIAIARERLQALRVLRPVRNDRLVRATANWAGEVGQIIEVSSIDRLGQVWVKGPGGYPTRPQDLRRLPS